MSSVCQSVRSHRQSSGGLSQSLDEKPLCQMKPSARSSTETVIHSVDSFLLVQYWCRCTSLGLGSPVLLLVFETSCKMILWPVVVKIFVALLWMIRMFRFLAKFSLKMPLLVSAALFVVHQKKTEQELNKKSGQKGPNPILSLTYLSKILFCCARSPLKNAHARLSPFPCYFMQLRPLPKMKVQYRNPDKIE